MEIDLDDPCGLTELTCEMCGIKLVWADVPSKYPCDATAQADCCSRIYHAYWRGSIRVFSTKDGE
jgi:hypothetical protein